MRHILTTTQAASALATHLQTTQPQLLASRRLVLAHADFVVPGHGPMFKVHK